MDNTTENILSEILKYLGYKENSSNNSNNCTANVDPTAGASNNCCRDLNLDIPGGFQDINPTLFVLIAEFIGNIVAGSLPFNVANTTAQWLNLIGQIIETYSTQQVYFQTGPGRYYNPLYRNVQNPFCSTECTSNNDNNSSLLIEIQKLTNEVTSLKNELNMIKKKMT